MAKQIVNRHTLDQMIKDYHWMIREIEIAEAKRGYNGAKIAGYGIEVTLPKASGGTSDPVGFEVMRRMRFSTDLTLRYRHKVTEVQKRSLLVQGEKEQYVLHHLLDGESMRRIAKKMNVSEATVRRLRESILDDMLNE